MKILLGNHHCFNFGGTENYTIDLARYYHSLGHQISIYLHTKQLKMVAYDYFRSKYPFIRWYITYLPSEGFDLLLLNHNTTLNSLKTYKGFKICTTHGLPHLERFVAGADHYVCISQELFDLYPKISNKTLIKTGFNCREIEEVKYQEILDKPTAILIDYTSTVESKEYFKTTCKKLNIWWEIFEGKNITPSGITNIFKNYDIICATGRTAIEALLSGKRTIIYSHFGCDGLFRYDLDRCNYSGRDSGNFDLLEESLKKALTLSEEEIQKVRNWIIQERDISVVAEEYLQIFREKR